MRAEIIGEIRAAHEATGQCAACGAREIIDTRNLYSTMGWFLVELAALTREEGRCFFNFHDVYARLRAKDVASAGGKDGRSDPTDHGKLALWGFVERKGSGRTGLYRITPDGLAFAEGEVSVLSHVDHVDGEIRRYHGEHIYIDDVLKKGRGDSQAEVQP